MYMMVGTVGCAFLIFSITCDDDGDGDGDDGGRRREVTAVGMGGASSSFHCRPHDGYRWARVDHAPYLPLVGGREGVVVVGGEVARPAVEHLPHGPRTTGHGRQPSEACQGEGGAGRRVCGQVCLMGVCLLWE